MSSVNARILSFIVFFIATTGMAFPVGTAWGIDLPSPLSVPSAGSLPPTQPPPQNGIAPGQAYSSAPPPGAQSPIIDPLEEPTKEERKEIYRSVLDQILPAPPSEIETIKKARVQAQKSISNLSDKYTIKSPVVSIHPGPGLAPVVVHIAPGNVSSIVFLDGTASGSPWPIADFENPTKILNVKKLSLNDHTLYVKATGVDPYFKGLVAVTLKSLSSPIPVLVISDGTEVDATTTIIVQGMSPITMARIRGGFVQDSSPDIGDAKNVNKIINVLAGIPPSSGARSVSFNKGDLNVDIEGWVDGKWLWLRLPEGVMLTSPSDKNQSHAEGWTAYQIPYFDVISLLYNDGVHNVEVNRGND